MSHILSAQWKADSTDKVPPREFDQAVQYRPILNDPKTQTQTGNQENDPHPDP